MRLLHRNLVVAMLPAITFAPLAFGGIKWDPKNKARFKGNGCDQDTASIIAAGPEMSIIFSDLGVDLQGTNAPLRQRKNCKAIIPVRVNEGSYIGRLRQTLTYGYVREKGTRGKLVAVSVFGRQRSNRIVTKVPTPGLDRLNVPFAQRNVVARWRRQPHWCRRDHFRTRLKINLVVVGKRRNTSQAILVQADGFDARFEASARIDQC